MLSAASVRLYAPRKSINEVTEFQLLFCELSVFCSNHLSICCVDDARLPFQCLLQMTNWNLFKFVLKQLNVVLY